MSVPITYAPEELLAQVGWVRALAAQVARDSHAADDLAQEALFVALRGDAGRARSLRGWLAAVTLRLERTRRRGEARRGQR